MANVETRHETVLDAGVTQSRIARVYAEALMATARKESPEAVETAGAELTELVVGLTAQPTVGALIGSPIIGKKVKSAALTAAFDGRASKPLRGLIAVLDQNNRLGLLRAIAAAYRQLLDERSGRVRVKVTAAVPLSDAQTSALTANLKAVLKQEPVLDVRVDADLLGGLLVQVGDTVVDSSVRTRLQSLRTLLIEKGGYGN